MADKADKDYRKLTEELDAILEALQTSDMGIDEAVKAYSHGMELVEELEKYLKTAENKITKIKKTWDADSTK